MTRRFKKMESSSARGIRPSDIMFETYSALLNDMENSPCNVDSEGKITYCFTTRRIRSAVEEALSCRVSGNSVGKYVRDFVAEHGLKDSSESRGMDNRTAYTVRMTQEKRNDILGMK